MMEARSIPALLTLEAFWEMFLEDGLGPPPACKRILAVDLPPPYQDLLAHREHMTVSMEEHHGGVAAIRVLASRLDENIYSRCTLLMMAGTEHPVQLGMVRLDLDRVSAPARREILGGQVPLGRVLIASNIHRRVELLACLEIRPTRELGALLAALPGKPLYGRLARIVCGGEGSIDLLEIAAPTGPKFRRNL